MSNNIHFIDKDWSVLNKLVAENNYSKLIVLVDSNTLQHCLPLFNPVLEQEFQVIEVEAGEASKDLEICAHIWQEFSEEAADRHALLINLGGGVVSDLGGFIASIYKRGISFIHIPTSLLAMVDASIGGKCGIDFLGFKNQLGSFSQAKAILIHPPFLATLANDEMLSGMAEMLKHGLIADKKHWQSLVDLDHIDLLNHSEIIKASINIKSIIVEADPFEKGERKKLNFGHTIGHAIESYFMAKDKAIKHGFAIAAGIMCESFLSFKLGLLELNEFEEINKVLRAKYQQLVFSKAEFSSILIYMQQDKKNAEGKNQFTLLHGIGNAVINQQVDEDLIVESLVYYCDSEY